MKPKELTCLRCGHKWEPRNPNKRPAACPRCKQYEWDRETKWKEQGK